MKKSNNKFYQRLLALVLALTLCIGMMPLAAFAEEGETIEPDPAPVTETVAAEPENPESAPVTVDPEPADPSDGTGGEEATEPNAEEAEAQEPVKAPETPVYATQADLDAAFEQVGVVLESGDVEAGIAALDAYIAVYHGLSPEDQAANAEALAAAMAYQGTLRGSLEGIADPEIETLAYTSYTSHITLYPGDGRPTGTKMAVGDHYNGNWYVEEISTSHVTFGSKYGEHNNNFLVPDPGKIWTGVSGQTYPMTKVKYCTCFSHDVNMNANGLIIYTAGHATYANVKNVSTPSSTPTPTPSPTPTGAYVTVVHNYYTNGNFDGTWSEDVSVSGNYAFASDYYKATYNGNTYPTKSHDPFMIKISGNGYQGTFTLTYNRTEAKYYGQLVYHSNDGRDLTVYDSVLETSTTGGYNDWLKSSNPFADNGKKFLGWGTSPGAATPAYPLTYLYLVPCNSTDKNNPTQTHLYAVWELSKPTATERLTVKKVFDGLDEIPTNFSIVWTETHGVTGDVATKTLTYDNAEIDKDAKTLTWKVPHYHSTSQGASHTAVVTENCDVQGYTYETTVTGSAWKVNGHTVTRNINDNISSTTLTITNTYTPDTPPQPEKPDITVVKTAEKNEYTAGEDVTWNITVTNNGSTEVSGLSIADSLTRGSGTVTVTAPAGLNGSVDNFTLAGGASATFTATLEEAAAGTYVNKAEVKKDGETVGEGTADGVAVTEKEPEKVTVHIKKVFSGITEDQIPNDFQITWTTGNDNGTLTIDKKDGLTYFWEIEMFKDDTLTLTESGTDIDGKTLSASAEANKAWINATFGGAAVAKPEVSSTGGAAANSGTSASGKSAGGYDVEDSASSSATVVTPPAPYVTITNTYKDVESENPPVTIAKTAKAATAKPGELVTYTVTITNNTDKQQTVTFKDDLAGGRLMLGNGTTLTPSYNGGDIEGSVSESFSGVGATFTLAARKGASITFEYTARVPANAAAGDKLANTATATVDGKDYTDTADVTVEEETKPEEKVTLTYNTNYGDDSMEDKTHAEADVKNAAFTIKGLADDALKEAGFTTPEGWEFLGWSTTRNGAVDVTYQIGKSLELATSINLYAVWKKPATSPDPSTSPSTSPDPSTSPSTSPDPSTSPSTSPDPSTSPSTSPDPSTSPSTSPDPSTSPSTSPDPSTEPTDDPTDIPDPTPPLTDTPDITPTPSTPPVTPDPVPTDPPVVIPDDDPPLAEIPDEDPPLAEIPDDTTEIDDEEVPLADVPKTGDDAKIWLALALLSAAGLGVLGLTQRRTRKNGEDS